MLSLAKAGRVGTGGRRIISEASIRLGVVRFSLVELYHFRGEVGKNASDTVLLELSCAGAIVNGKDETRNTLITQFLYQLKIQVLVVKMPREWRELLDFGRKLQRNATANWRQWPAAIQLLEFSNGFVIKR